MTDLRVDLSATRDFGIAVGAFPRMHVRRPMGRLRTVTAEQMADRIGHQHADHAHLSQMSIAYQTLRLICMHGVMPWTTDKELPVAAPCQLHQFNRLSNG